MKLNKLKILGIIIVLLIAFTGCESKDNEINDNKSVELQTVIVDDEGVSWEDIGQYKICLDNETNPETGVLKKTSIYVYDKSDKKRLIEEVNEDSHLSPSLITDGVYMYYSLSEAVLGHNSAGTIYKLDLASGEKEVLANIDSMVNLVGIYEDLIYYTAYNDTLMKLNLLSYSLEGKEVKLVKEDFEVIDQFGKYLIGAKRRHDPNTMHYMIDLETGACTEIMSAWKIHLLDNSLVYSKYAEDNSAGMIIGECDYSGNIIKENLLADNEKLWFIGRKEGFLVTIDGDLCKYDNDFKTLESVNFNVEERLIGHWENFLRTSMADTIDLDFDEDGKVTCTMPREIYYGTYKIDSENIYMEFKEGELFVPGSAEWIQEKNADFKIKGKIKYNRIDLKLGDGEGWNISVSKSL